MPFNVLKPSIGQPRALVLLVVVVGLKGGVARVVEPHPEKQEGERSGKHKLLSLTGKA